jgi:phosphatidylglycerophosphate synthase
MPPPNATTFALLRRQTANIVSILGVLPIAVLVFEGGGEYLIPLMLYNNIMDDLDGVLATKLGISSAFGARLDNVCDAIAHTVFVMVAATAGGAVTWVAGSIAATAIIVRSVSRLGPRPPGAQGSPTNELVRHVLFILLLTKLADVSAAPFLTVAFAVHAVSMHVTYRMPLLLRSVTSSASAIGLLNVALVVAWLVPYATPVIAAAFILTYVASFIWGAVRRGTRGATGG